MDFTPHEFAELYGEIYVDLYRFALYSLGNEEDAKDAVSDAVLDGFRQRETLREKSAFRQWMFAILSNKCKRKKREYADRREYEQLPEEDSNPAEELPKPETEVSEAVAVRELFSRLPQEEQQILALRLFAGYNSREIGRFLGMSPGTIRSKEHRALAKLRKEIMEHER